MRVAIYTVALNEEKHVERWHDSTREADFHLIADTGSTDKTRTIARKLGIKIVPLRLNPWRFDDSRNAALAALPVDIDYCVSLDVDEVLLPGWRRGLEQAFEAGIDWPKYDYVFSWRSEGIPHIEFKGIKIHPRWGVRWKYPIHEIPVTCDGWKHNWGWAFPDWSC
jgi:glycosyltransferase involved in cell wall biosynthesis